MDTTTPTDFGETTDRAYGDYLRGLMLDPAYIASHSAGIRKLFRSGYDLALRQEVNEATAEAMIRRACRVCTVCQQNPLDPGEDLCGACSALSDDAEFEVRIMNDILSGDDLHNTCQGCGTDAHSNAYCTRCADEIDGLIEMRARKELAAQGLGWPRDDEGALRLRADRAKLYGEGNVGRLPAIATDTDSRNTGMTNAMRMTRSLLGLLAVGGVVGLWLYDWLK